MAGIDAHAKACKLPLMQDTILSEVEAFIADTGLSEHRAGILLARNGKLVERLRAGGRIWPETQRAIRDAIQRERKVRLAAKQKGAA